MHATSSATRSGHAGRHKPRSGRWPFLTLGLLALTTLAGSPLKAQQWERFRGPNGSGAVSPDAGRVTIPNELTEEDILWKVALPGVGHSSPVVAVGPNGNARLFLTSGDEETGERFVLAVNASDGRVLWKQGFPLTSHRKHKLNSFASPTPVADDSFVYTAWGTPEAVTIQCFDHDGKLHWRRNLGEFRGGHGFGVSPMLTHDLLIVPLEQQGPSRLLALSRTTGETQWEVQRESNVHYSTPCLFGGRDGDSSDSPHLVFTNWEQGITGLDPATGKMLWSSDAFDKSHVECSIGSPIVAGDLVIGTCGWLGHGNEVVAVRPNGSPEAEVVYRITRGAPLCTTPLVCGNLLFLWADNGIVTCADVATGKPLWQKRVGGNYYASPICANGKILNMDVDGNLIVLRAAADYEPLGKSDLGEGTHSSPAIAGGRLYIRTFSQLIAIAIQADRTGQ